MRATRTLLLRATIGSIAVILASGAGSELHGTASPRPASIAPAGDLHYRQWTIEQGLPQGSVRQVAQTSDGYLWIATFDGLVRFDGVRMVVFSKSEFPEMISSRCVSVLVDRQGAVWVGTEDGGVMQVVANRVRVFGRSQGLESESTHTVAEDAGGRIWTLTEVGPLFFDGHRWKRPGGAERFPEFVTPRRVQTLLDSLIGSAERSDLRWTAGANGRIWAYVAGRLHRHEAGAWTTFPSPLPAIVGLPTALFEDREGSLWIGGDHGLVQASPAAVRSIVPEMPGQRNIYTLAEDASRRIWIAPQGAPLLWEDGSLTSLATERWWPRAAITAIVPDADGSILAGGPDGIFRVWPRDRYEKLSDEPHSHVSAFLRDRRGTLWIATGRGLLKMAPAPGPKGSATWQWIAGLPSSDLKVLLEARDGALWIGAYGGQTRLTDGRIQTWTRRPGELPTDRIRALHEDEEGTLWIGTYDGGLIRFAAGRFVPIQKRNGLFDDGAFAILDGGDGRYYMSSNRGIYSVAKQELAAFAAGAIPRVTSRAYRSGDGMPSSECNGGLQPSGLRAADGTLWFPTQGGIAIVDPRAVRANLVPPRVVVEEVAADDRTIPPDAPIELAPHERRLEVRFTAATFVRSEGVQFRYQLAGYDRDWVEAGNRRLAQYTRLPPGHYTLTIAAANGDGVWSTEGASLAVRVNPYWWQTRWFQAGCVLAGMAGMVTAYRRRVSGLERRRREQDVFARRLLESQEAERKRIANELHDGIAQTLALIRNRALLGLRDGADAALTQVSEISEVARDAIEEVRKVSYGLRPYQIDRLGLTRALEALVEQTSASSAVTLSANVAPIDGLVARDDEINLYRIVQEALSNMVRHARATKGTVTVAVREREIEIRIEDDGIGFDPAARADHAGLGLAGMAERARILGGRTTIRSAPGQGTTVIATVPVNGM